MGRSLSCASLVLISLLATGCAARLDLFGWTLIDSGVGTRALHDDESLAPIGSPANASFSADVATERAAAIYAQVERSLQLAIQNQTRLERSAGSDAEWQQVLANQTKIVASLQTMLEQWRARLPADHPAR